MIVLKGQYLHSQDYKKKSALFKSNPEVQRGPAFVDEPGIK